MILTRLRLLLTVFSAIVCSIAMSTSNTVVTENKLKQLSRQITQLKTTLSKAHDKHSALHLELASIEKRIGENVRQVQLINHNVIIKQEKINSLRRKLTEFNEQLLQQQHLLAKHVRTRYHLGEYQPIKWLLNQNDPQVVSRLLNYYQYIITSRKEAISQVNSTCKAISLNQNTLKKELSFQQVLQKKLHNQHQRLEENRRYHRAVLHTLASEMQSKQHLLKEYERNRENLTHLLKALSVQTTMQVKRPFNHLRHKLPKPVQGNSSPIKMNQGLTFFAAEGSRVSAIYPGKVVFSDWLRGYGLLLIIDHGQGFMTLYAHNESLFKTKGSQVFQGEQIATVGHSGGLKQNGLYFEVRYRGKAIPPSDWLA